MAAARSELRGAALRDARWAQIAALCALAAVGLLILDFRVDALHLPVALGGCLAAEWIGRRAQGRPFDPLSPIITALSLTLLLRAGDLGLVFLAALLGVGSKFLLRLDGRHLFNPANFGLGLVTLAAPAAWMAPGQWGALGLGAVAMAGLGAAVAGRADRLDSALGFLGVWAALLFARAAWLGDPHAIPTHQLQSGAVLVFAFFMISDPMTTPETRAARLVHAALVAMVGFQLQVAWLSDVGPIHALLLLAPTVPALNRAAAALAARASRKDTACGLHPSSPAPRSASVSRSP